MLAERDDPFGVSFHRSQPNSMDRMRDLYTELLPMYILRKILNVSKNRLYLFTQILADNLHPTMAYGHPLPRGNRILTRQYCSLNDLFMVR